METLVAEMHRVDKELAQMKDHYEMRIAELEALELKVSKLERKVNELSAYRQAPFERYG